MARRQAPPRWICPVCDRSVPANEPTCYCGTSRAAVEAHTRRERERTRRPFPWTLFLGELGVVAIVVYWFFARGQTREAPSPASVAMPAVPPGDAPSMAPSPSPVLQPPTALPTPTPLPRADEADRPKPTFVMPTPRRPRPSIPPEPERAELDVEREAGAKRLEQTLTRLQAEMTALSEDARQFEGICLSRHGEPRSCKRLQEEMSSAGETLARGLEAAEDDARRSWVAPGVVRDLRQKHGVDESAWRDLSETVNRLTNQYRGGS